ncbi:MAG: SLC13/DASS family transporter [Phaeodactylibacter sp.]|nr:SLC13/DASS family transporter [Phaeodactylibacter sp.]MCB9052656.1 SLC13/DASS family transporter [Lewinellaceae bacterium]
MGKNKMIGLIGGLIVFLIILALPSPAGLSPEGKRAAAVALLMTAWWITEAIPIYATAFLPLALYPLLGILPAEETAANYGHNYVLMLLAGFFLAKAIELQHLHKRIALVVIKFLGTSRRTIILSFMIATAFLSMWIANVAVALLMLPIALAIINKEESQETQTGSFGLAMMLAIAYAASVGGTATLIGTPPNMVFAGMISKLFPEAPEISFFTWMKVGLPVVLVFLPVIWIYITRYFRISGSFSGSQDIIDSELRVLGKMSAGEKRVFVIFLITALGWVFRRDFVFDETVIPGWATLLGVGDYVHDSTVAVACAMFLFLLPEGQLQGKRLLDWKAAESVPWGVVMIVGGGYAIADSFKATGLAEWVGQELAFISQMPTLLVLLLVVGLMIFLTEINSNTATANIFLPVLATMAVAGSANPLLLMIPATFACSFAFMLPSGTGTNTVIFASERVTIPQMAKCGLWLNFISIILLTLLLYLVVVPLLGIETELPGWAR